MVSMYSYVCTVLVQYMFNIHTPQSTKQCYCSTNDSMYSRCVTRGYFMYVSRYQITQIMLIDMVNTYCSNHCRGRTRNNRDLIVGIPLFVFSGL